jgi:hypothetical protein
MMRIDFLCPSEKQREILRDRELEPFPGLSQFKVSASCHRCTNPRQLGSKVNNRCQIDPAFTGTKMGEVFNKA